MLKWRYMITIMTGFLCLLCVACAAKREKADFMAFATIVEKTKPDGEKLLDRFKALAQINPNDPQKLAEQMDQLVLDIDTFLQPVRKLDIRSKQVEKIRAEYLLIWTSLQKGMKMSLEVMVVRDPRNMAALNDKLMEQNSIFIAALQQFNTDYMLMIQRYGITHRDLGMPEQALPPQQPQPQQPPQQPQPLPFSPVNRP